MKTLAPVDFKAVAAQGCFVYCYLRAKGSKTAKAGTPYYIGIAKRARRPFEKHDSCSVPNDSAHVRLMRSGLGWEEACRWEQLYVKRFGRKCFGAGILLNRTDGGDGVCNPSRETRRLIGLRSGASRVGIDLSEAHRANLSIALKGVPKAPEHVAAVAASLRGKPKSPESIEKMRRTKTGQKQSPKHVEARRLGMLGHVVTMETREKLSRVHKGRTFSDATKQRMSEAGKARKPPSLETKMKLSLAAKGKTKTAEQIKAASEGRKAANAARRLLQGITPEMYEEQRAEAARRRKREWWAKQKAA
jgi:hypothetical protein